MAATPTTSCVRYQFGGKRSVEAVRRERLRRRRGRPVAEWEVQFVTAREVEPSLRPNVLGIHFGVDPVLWWCLTDQHGTVLKQGKREGNEILTQALSKALHLHEEQGKQKWVGGRKFQKELRQRTLELAKWIVGMAGDSDANLVLESIKWVDKRGGDHQLNQRHSLWNYGELPKKTEWVGLESQNDELGIDPVITLKPVSDFLLAFTCPSCGACRNKGQKKPATERLNGTLKCHRCGYANAPLSDEKQAELVAKLGAKDLRSRSKT